MNIRIQTYDEFINDHKKYDGSDTCFIPGCDKPAYYEGGDYRFYCSVCEEHANLKECYLSYLQNIETKIRIRMLWDKDDPTLKTLYPTLKFLYEELTKDGQTTNNQH